MDQETIDGLAPGIRNLVLWLNDAGFCTIDSGDGSNYEAGMGCAVPSPMVAIHVENPIMLIVEADRLALLLFGRGVDFTSSAETTGVMLAEKKVTWPMIQATYNPHDGQAIILLINVTSAMVRL